MRDLREAHRGLPRRRPDRRDRQQQHGPGHDQPVPHRSRRLPEPVRRGAQHRRAPAGLRLVSRRRAGRAGRYLPHQVVHRGRHPPERHPVGDAAADRVHGHLDRPDRRQGDSRQGRGDDLRRRERRRQLHRGRGRGGVRGQDPGAARDRQRGDRHRRPVQPVAERRGDDRRAPLQVTRQAAAHPRRRDAPAARRSSSRSTRLRRG